MHPPKRTTGTIISAVATLLTTTPALPQPPTAAADSILTAISVEDVVVTGQFEAQSLKNSVFQVRSIGSQTIKQKAATNALAALNTELGFRLSNDMTLGETDVQIMGMAGQNVKVLIDGVPLVDRGSTKQSISHIDINTIKRIEIVEGPMSVVYGTDALAGVINIITKDNTANATTTPLSINVRMQEESAGNEYSPVINKGIHHESVNVNYNSSKGWNAGATITRNNFGGWQGTYTGRAKEWKPKDQLFATASCGYKAQLWNASYRLNFMDETLYGLGDINAYNIAQDRNYLTRRYTHTLLADAKWNNQWNSTFAATYQDYQRQTQTTLIDMTTGNRRKTVGAGEQDLSTFRTAFARGSAHYKHSATWTLQGGAEYRIDEGSGDRIDGTQRIADYSLFLSAEIKPLPTLNIRPGIRYTYNSVYNAPPAIPSINALLHIRPDLDLRLSYARGFRAPALRELYFKFVDGNHNIYGNTNLEAEYSNCFTASLTWQATENTPVRYSAALSGFYNMYSNLITTAIDAYDNTKYSYVNVDKFRTTGAALHNNLMWQQLHISVGVAYIGRYNIYIDDEQYDSEDMPAFNWSPEVNATIAYQVPTIAVDINVFCKYTGATPILQLDDEGNLSKRKTDGYLWTDVSASKTLFKYLTLNVGVKNLFNVTIVQNTAKGTGDHASSGALPMSYGRSWFAGAVFQW
jgi:outer membrane receptor for ferrienterochelin and colicins